MVQPFVVYEQDPRPQRKVSSDEGVINVGQMQKDFDTVSLRLIEHLTRIRDEDKIRFLRSIDALMLILNWFSHFGLNLESLTANEITAEVSKRFSDGSLGNAFLVWCRTCLILNEVKKNASPVNRVIEFKGMVRKSFTDF